MTKSESARFWEHPVTLLLLGAVLTSIIIPVAGYFITSSQARRDLRREKAVQIMRACDDLNGKITRIEVSLEMFETEVMSPNSKIVNYPNRLSEFRPIIYTAQAEIDSAVWWRFWELCSEAATLELVNSVERAQLEECAKLMNGFFGETEALLQPVRMAYLSTSEPPVKPIYGPQKGKLGDLHQERYKLSRRMAGILN